MSVGGALEVDDGVLQALNGVHDVLPVVRGVDDNHNSFHRQRRVSTSNNNFNSNKIICEINKHLHSFTNGAMTSILNNMKSILNHIKSILNNMKSILNNMKSILINMKSILNNTKSILNNMKVY